MNREANKTNETFIKEYQSALSHALSIFDSRQKEGRNLFMPPYGMFCFGVSSAGTLLWMKVCRLLGNIKGDNKEKMIEECEDIINYAAMLIALIRTDTSPNKTEK